MNAPDTILHWDVDGEDDFVERKNDELKLARDVLKQDTGANRINVRKSSTGF